MNLIIEQDGSIRGIYGEEIALDALGRPEITRASHVEPDDRGRWLADLSPVGGPVLGPFERRSEALEVEVAWLEEHWLVAQSGVPGSVPSGSGPGVSIVGSTGA